jgi:hypothetical protein
MNLYRIEYSPGRHKGLPWALWNYTARPNESLGWFATREEAEEARRAAYLRDEGFVKTAQGWVLP